MEAPGARARVALAGEGVPRVKQEDSEILQPHDLGFRPKHQLARYGNFEQSAQPEAAKEAVSVKEDPVDMEEAEDKQDALDKEDAIDKATSMLEFKTVLVKEEPMDMEEDVAQREALDSEEQAAVTQNAVGIQNAEDTRDAVATKWETVFVKQEPVDEDDMRMPAAPGESQADVVFTNNSVRSNVVELGKKRVYPSASQKSRLIALVQGDEELRRGKFSSSFTKREGERRWANIAHEVNSIPGTNREWKEWRKTWQDMKAAAKKKSAAFRFSVTSTGVPPAPPRENVATPISMSSRAVFGHTDGNESIVHFQDVPSTSSKPSMSDETRTDQVCIKVEVEYEGEESGTARSRGSETAPRGGGAPQGTKAKARRPQPPPQPSECEICHRKVASLSKLKEHMRIHTGEKPFRCETCQKGFTQTSHLKKHVRIHTGEKPYTCEICKKDFTLLDSLKIHQRIHTGEKPYSCKRCEKKFGDLSTLKRHGRIHTNEKPYTCNVCQKGFAQLGSLKVHERTHTGEKPYECEVCHKKFSESGTLKRHERIHTGEKPYTCEVCERAFTELGCLNKHRRTHYKALKFKACQDTFSEHLTEEINLPDPAGVEYMAAADGDPGGSHVDFEADITLKHSPPSGSVQASSDIQCSNT